MPLESFSARWCLLSSAIFLLKPADFLAGSYCNNIQKYTPIKCQNQPNCELQWCPENTLTSTSQLHLQGGIPPREKWTQVCESLDSYLSRKVKVVFKTIKCCTTEVHRHFSLLLQYSSKSMEFFFVASPPLWILTEDAELTSKWSDWTEAALPSPARSPLSS